MPEVFISYSHDDVVWVRALAQRLEAASVSLFFDEWDIDLGANIVHGLDEAIRASTNAILVFSPAAVRSGWVREEYTALVHQSVDRGLLFIPVLYGDVELPPIAANRLALDFRNAGEERYDTLVQDLIRRLKGQPRERGGGDRHPAVRFPEASRPIVAPDVHSIVLSCAEDDAEYTRRFGARLRAQGLPVWWSRDLELGQDWEWTLRQQIEFAVCLVVVMTSAAQASERVTQMILYARTHSRVVVPVLLGDMKHYLLANSWYFDGRGGHLPGPGEAAMFQRLQAADQQGEPLTDILPPPIEAPRPAAVKIPAPVALEALRRRLADRKFEEADILTTALLLQAGGGSDTGWVDAAGARRIPVDTLAGVDALWARASTGEHGFTAQRDRYRVRACRHADFLDLSMELGWRESLDELIPAYAPFVRRAAGRTGFYPTLRNPQNEPYLDWYEHWWLTSVAVHSRLITDRLATDQRAQR